MSTNEFNLILVQPGATELDEQGRLVGSLDVPLSALGESQVNSIAQELSDFDIGMIVCAPDLAAQQTAQRLSSDGSTRIRIEENLANLDVGLWHGKSIEELKETQPKIYRQWREHPEIVTPPEGEPIEHALNRVRKTMKWINKKNRSMTILIVAAHPLAALVQAEALGADLAEFWNTEGVCGSWSQLGIDSAIAVD